MAVTDEIRLRPNINIATLLGRNNHTWENGRRYHGHAPEFPFPDDQSFTFGAVWDVLVDRKPFVAPLALPLQRKTKVLSVPGRDGGWASMLWDDENVYSKARYSAVEPAYMQGQGQEARGGVRMVHEGFEGPWPFTRDEAFHLVYVEGLGGLIGDYTWFYGNVFGHTAPGGGVEIPCREWKDDPTTKKTGDYYNWAFGDALEGYSLRLFTKTLGWSREDTDDLLSRILGRKPADTARQAKNQEPRNRDTREMDEIVADCGGLFAE
ncbi:uncharacterized protein DSM5745_02525 [Aspergillus mulundensis]|uniref:Uncharacterized protein n=1 Tax=Aspergillus mulundensis TaxID=1810919 RepID=A0A3D8SWU9_9EURO|nr:hypothetical protein DSM5745_02525 [Aspergillus mulundensis]RDW90750.1 hypothetical protein DSM5745_02525 [Aspergillus mulundensis]